MPPPRALVVGVDVGGTVTGLVFVDAVTGAVRMAKVPTTVANGLKGTFAALLPCELRLEVTERMDAESQPVIDPYLRRLAGELVRYLVPVAPAIHRGGPPSRELGPCDEPRWRRRGGSAVVHVDGRGAR